MLDFESTQVRTGPRLFSVFSYFDIFFMMFWTFEAKEGLENNVIIVADRPRVRQAGIVHS